LSRADGSYPLSLDPVPALISSRINLYTSQPVRGRETLRYSY